jgi:hypothetical protein
VANTIAANITGSIRGGYFYVDVEDATVALADGINVATPYVDTGALTTGYGIHVIQGAKGAGSITTLYGLKIDDITNGSTNRGLVVGKGISMFGDTVTVTGWQDLCQFTVVGHTTQAAGTGLVEFERINTTAGLNMMMSLINKGSGADNDGGYIEMKGYSTSGVINMARIAWQWYESTHATRSADLVFSAYDTAIRECIRVRGLGSAAGVGLYGTVPVDQAAAMTAQLTTMTCASPASPDYAIVMSPSNMETVYGFSNANEANTCMKVIINLQERVDELEAMLSANAGGIGVCV